MSTPPCDLDAERGVLGALIAFPRYLDGVLVDAGLRADHFYFDRHGEIFRAMVALGEKDRLVDEVSLNAELRERGTLADVGEHLVGELYATCPAGAKALEYAQVVVREAEWRVRVEAHGKLGEAIGSRDREKLARVEELLQVDLTHNDSDLEPSDLREIAFKLLEGEGAEAFPWSFPRLNDLTAGGMRRGEFVVIGGHSSHGKSQFLDQTLLHLHKSGLRTRLYMNEMSAQQRVARTLTRRTKIPYSKIINGDLSEPQHKLANKVLNEESAFPFGITLAAGWSALDIAHHIRRHRYDVVAVDIMHLIEYEDERDLSGISATFARTALQADCVVIATAHLNEKRVQSIERPRPTLGDVRGSGAIKNDADIVCFVHRDQNSKTGDPEPQGAIYFAKVRNGPTGGMKVRFREEDLSFFELADERHEPAPREEPEPVGLFGDRG